MGDRFRDCLSLLDQVYAAVDSELDWYVLLDTLRDWVDADMAAMFCWDKQTEQLSWMWQIGHSQESFRLYHEHYASPDPLRRNPPKLTKLQKALPRSRSL
ncbi:hypothetical protein QU487_18105 [Crenobacter sp. SG2305]|uniref:hypothetical protein n=1 Tax=Crenobacter oryzisoli TaxID=3056844 RepID=UPI0025AAF675|nr:hypothetical protein [Crenobacter sp. SG2305]MDN0084651.1 hypothetical protein [Crenobacter sp. SG2305]